MYTINAHITLDIGEFMKKMMMLVMFVSVTSAFAIHHCPDKRVTTFSECEEGERHFVQGSCPMPYQVEASYCAIEGAPDCHDLRATHYPECKTGKLRIYVQGQCKKKYQAEFSYCAKR